LLDNFANLVINYKTKHEIFIFSIIRRSKTIITIFQVIVSTSLVDIIVLVLLLKKCDRLFKITKNALISKKREKSFKIKTTISNKQDNNIETFSLYCC